MARDAGITWLRGLSQYGRHHIVSDPAIRRGRPHIKGTGITVQNIVEDVTAGLTAGYITEQFDLTLGQVYAALSYYYDHQAEIDQAIAQDQANREYLQESDEYKASQERTRQIKARLEAIQGVVRGRRPDDGQTQGTG